MNSKYMKDQLFENVILIFNNKQRVYTYHFGTRGWLNLL